MPAPTRAEIEATVTTPTYLLEYWNGSTWVTLPGDDVLDISPMVGIETASGGLDFGAASNARVSIKLAASATVLGLAWNGLKIRASFGFAAATPQVRAVGIITGRQRSLFGFEVEFTVAGFAELVRTTAVYSPLFYRRLPFTPTSVSSVEDPTNVAYAAGLGNYILWTAGGRPLEQAATYPTAIFYYTCQSALIAPEWSWIAGEDAWAELDRLCRGCGGQIVQQPDGTVAYLNPLAPTPSGYALTEAWYEDVKEAADRSEYIASARCSFSARRIQPQQVVYEDTTPRLVGPSSTVQITIDLERPVYDFVTRAAGVDTLPDDGIVAFDLNTYQQGYPLVFANYVTRSAGRAVVQLNNNLTTPVYVTKLQLRGRPIAVVETGQASYGSGSPERPIGDQGAIYIQSRQHAERLCRLYVDVYGTVRPQIALLGLGYDPDRTLGEVVALTVTDWSVSAQNHRIVSIGPKDTGATMELTVTPITNIPTTADLFMVGTTYAGSDVRQLGW